MSIKTIHTFHRLGQLADGIFEKEMDKFGTTARQAIVISAISDAPGGSQHDLVDSTHIDRSTLSDIVRRLEKDGFAKRTRSREDARAYKVTLTPEGQRAATAIHKVSPSVAKQITEVARGLGVTLRS